VGGLIWIHLDSMSWAHSVYFWNVKISGFRKRFCMEVGDSGSEGSWNTRVGGFRGRDCLGGCKNIGGQS
jgi:hypothetical protein